jgi:hypothetical protein
MKVLQCVSTKCGFHKHLKLGEWYLVEENQLLRKPFSNEIAINHWYLNKFGVYVGNVIFYDRSLFRSLDEKRDYKLSKLGV